MRYRGCEPEADHRKISFRSMEKKKAPRLELVGYLGAFRRLMKRNGHYRNLCQTSSAVRDGALLLDLRQLRGSQ